MAMMKAPRKRIWNATFVLFVGLFVLSFAYYAGADENGNRENFFQDTDNDGLSNEEEKALGTDPNNVDTDGDGYSDGVEVESGYNPLKSSPGDKIISEQNTSSTDNSSGASLTTTTTTDNNYTLKTSEALASIVQGVTTNDDPSQGVKSEDVDSALQKSLGETTDEIVLPAIDIKTIKIKKIPKGLKGDAKKEREKKDVIEYLTLMSYIMVNNSPVAIQSQNDLQKVTEQITTDSMNSLSSGNMAYLNTLETQGKKFLDQIKDVEVPESMVDTHVRALQLAEYAVGLKSELQGTQTDPLGQVASYGKLQAFLTEVQSFADDVQTKLTDYGIQDLPLGL